MSASRGSSVEAVIFANKINYGHLGLKIGDVVVIGEMKPGGYANVYNNCNLWHHAGMKYDSESLTSAMPDEGIFYQEKKYFEDRSTQVRVQRPKISKYPNYGKDAVDVVEPYIGKPYIVTAPKDSLDDGGTSVQVVWWG